MMKVLMKRWLAIFIEIIKGTNKAWDNVKEPWRFCITIGSVGFVSFFLPDILFGLFIILLIAWRMLGESL